MMHRRYYLSSRIAQMGKEQPKAGWLACSVKINRSRSLVGFGLVQLQTTHLHSAMKSITFLALASSAMAASISRNSNSFGSTDPDIKNVP